MPTQPAPIPSLNRRCGPSKRRPSQNYSSVSYLRSMLPQLNLTASNRKRRLRAATCRSQKKNPKTQQPPPSAKQRRYCKLSRMKAPSLRVKFQTTEVLLRMPKFPKLPPRRDTLAPSHKARSACLPLGQREEAVLARQLQKTYDKRGNAARQAPAASHSASMAGAVRTIHSIGVGTRWSSSRSWCVRMTK